MDRFYRLVTLSISMLLLISCGGGGSSDDTNPNSQNLNAGNQARFLFDCDLNGANGELRMDVEAVGGSGAVWGPGANPEITAVIDTGDVTLYTSGELISNAAYYTFTGENQFADFTDHTFNERFRVQWQETDNGLNMIVNPFGPGPAQHGCTLSESFFL